MSFWKTTGAVVAGLVIYSVGLGVVAGVAALIKSQSASSGQ